jgi:hypothetical protein
MACARGCCPDQKTHYRSIQWAGQGAPRVKEGRDKDGHRFKAVTDELNNTVTQRHGDRQDVLIRPEPIPIDVNLRSP